MFCFQITYHCSKLVEQNLPRVEQKVRSYLHTFQGRCWDGIRFHFHTCKLLRRQIQSVDNCLSVSTPGIAAFFPRCTLEIRFWHIYKCKGVETLFWDHDILSNKYKFSLPLAHTPHRSGQVFTTMGSLQLGFAFSQNSSLSQHVTVIISIGKTKTAGNIIMDIIILGTLLDLYFALKLPLHILHVFWHADWTKSKVQSTPQPHHSFASLHSFGFHSIQWMKVKKFE